MIIDQDFNAAGNNVKVFELEKGKRKDNKPICFEFYPFVPEIDECTN